MRGNTYTFGFALAVCVVCAVALGGAVTALKDKQEFNKMVDKQRNILGAAQLLPKNKKLVAKEVSQLYKERIQKIRVNQQGEILTTPEPEDAPECVEGKTQKELKVYIKKDPKNPDQAGGYIIPVCGKGLWSTMYGYLALEKDLNHVEGISFYQHGETPGLGAEIEAEWFTSNFTKGKQILDENGKLVSITVVKGEAPEDAKHKVDGISGATFTANGVTNLLQAKLEAYNPYFQRQRDKLAAQNSATEGPATEPVGAQP